MKIVDRAAEVFAAFMEGPCTKQDLCNRIGAKYNTHTGGAARLWIRALTKRGVIRFVGYRGRAGVWELNR